MKLRQQQALSADCWEITRETPSFHKTSQPLQGHQFPVFPDYQLQESNILSKNVDDCVWVNADYPLLFAYKHKHTLTHPHVHNLLWGVKQVGGTCKETQSPLFPGIVQHTEWCILWAVSVWRINHTSHWNVSFVNTLTHFLRDLLKLWLQIPSKPPLGQIPACAHCECRRVFVIMRTSARDALESICVDYHTFPPAAL